MCVITRHNIRHWYSLLYHGLTFIRMRMLRNYVFFLYNGLQWMEVRSIFLQAACLFNAQSLFFSEENWGVERWERIESCSLGVDWFHRYVRLTGVVTRYHATCGGTGRLRTPQWGAADAEIEVPPDENTEPKGSPCKAWNRSVYCHACYAYCQGFLPCLLLPFRSIHLHFFQSLSQVFHVSCG